MGNENDAKPGPVSAVADVRRDPLDRLSATAADSLKRIIPPVESARVLVAAFNASL